MWIRDRRNDPELAARLRVVETLGPAPIQPVVVRSGLDPAVKEELRARLWGLSGPVLDRFFVERFAPPPDYSRIAAVVAGAVRPTARR